MCWSSNLIDCSWWVLPNRYWADYGLISFQAFTQCGILSHYTINDFPVASEETMVFVFIPLSHRFDIEIPEWTFWNSCSPFNHLIRD